MSKKLTNDDLVYSTDGGRHCPQCRQVQSVCCCLQGTLTQGDGTLQIRRETKGRAGKMVTCVRGCVLPASELKALLARLKRRCGCGGTVQQGVIEIQGNQLDFLTKELEALGFKVKKNGA